MDKIEFWEDKDRQTVDPGLFSSQAERFAKKMADDHDHSRRKSNKRTQVRKFFDEVVHLDMTAKSRPDDWPSILPLVHMMTAKAAYAKGRGLVSDAFLEFIKQSVEQVQSPKDLSLFATFFEAFIGFYRLYGPSN